MTVAFLSLSTHSLSFHGVPPSLHAVSRPLLSPPRRRLEPPLSSPRHLSSTLLAEPVRSCRCHLPSLDGVAASSSPLHASTGPSSPRHLSCPHSLASFDGVARILLSLPRRRRPPSLPDKLSRRRIGTEPARLPVWHGVSRMLEVRSVAAEVGLNMDFADYYKTSDLYKGDANTLRMVIGAMYTAVIFVGINNCATLQPIVSIELPQKKNVSIERTVFYRDRAAGMYSAMPYAIAQVLRGEEFVPVKNVNGTT